MEIRRLLDEHHSDMRIIAKLENQEGVNNVDEILAVADGVMIARGDMGVEIDFTEIPVIQKDIIAYTPGLRQACHHGHPDARQHDHEPPAHPCRDHRRGQRRV